MFEKLILNPYVKNALKQYMDKGQKNAQHLILSGPQGTGKRTCADILAHFLLDIRLDKPLHSCADFFCLDCDQASIKLSDTEDLREFISYSSTVRRVVLIDNANQDDPKRGQQPAKRVGRRAMCIHFYSTQAFDPHGMQPML